jgi:hypothetical protein
LHIPASRRDAYGIWEASQEHLRFWDSA